MSHFETSNNTKKKILAACVRMFVEKGYKETTMLDIIRESGVSAGTFQNLFRTKDGALGELVSFMFNWQFDRAKLLAKGRLTPLAIYSYETALQIALCEQSENIREIYLEAYSSARLLEPIHQAMVPVLKGTFSSFHSDWTDADFFELEIGSAGLMRSYMSYPCNVYFPLSKKISRFLEAAYRLYDVPKDAIKETRELLSGVDFERIGKETMEVLFKELETAFDFQFNG